MDDPETIQANLDRAQEDLEHDISDLKDVVRGKLEGPKRVIVAVEQPVKFIGKHAAWFGIGAIALVGLLVFQRTLRMTTS
ncbi:MAG: hypothetical protein QM831_22520 [Kofleriaceae bacterium]